MARICLTEILSGPLPARPAGERDFRATASQSDSPAGRAGRGLIPASSRPSSRTILRSCRASRQRANYSSFWALLLFAFFYALPGAALAQDLPAPGSVSVHPPAIELRHPRQPQSLQVLGLSADGFSLDLS